MLELNSNKQETEAIRLPGFATPYPGTHWCPDPATTPNYGYGADSRRSQIKQKKAKKKRNRNKDSTPEWQA